MKKVENGMFVSVYYKGTLKNGETFDSSHENNPLEVEIGSGALIKGFENALMGMSLNEKKAFSIEAEEAYGQRDESLVYSFARKDIPADMELEVGQMVGLNSPQGHQIPAQVVEVNDEKVTVDMNHPLAGEKLNFEIEIMGISDIPTQVSTGCGSGCSCSSECC
jgi:peptidylprolyl isomerase